MANDAMQLKNVILFSIRRLYLTDFLMKYHEITFLFFAETYPGR